jgi:hypothetical protein
MIKPKPDRISRLARSTNLSKILKSGPPERCPWDRGPEFYLKVSSNLVRLANFCIRLFVWLHPSPFLRELFKVIEVRPSSQAYSLFPVSIPLMPPSCQQGIGLRAKEQEPARLTSRAGSLKKIRNSARRHRIAHKYQRITGANAPEPLRLTGD